MRVIIEFRKPSKRVLWKLQQLDKWFDRHLPQALTSLSIALFSSGFIMVIGTVGSIECDEAITWPLIRIGFCGFVAMVLGGAIWEGLCHEED